MSLPLVDIIMINEELELYPSISRVQRYLNLWFLLCPSLLRLFNLIRNEIVWQICCSLLLLTVPVGFIFSSPSPPPLPPPHVLSGQNRNTEAITWKYRCPTVKSLSHWTCLQREHPGWWPCSCGCAEDWPWQRSFCRRCGRVPFSCLVPGDPSAFAAPTNVDLGFVHFWLHRGTWICSSREPRAGTDWTETLYEWVRQLPNEISSHSKPIVCGEVPPVVVGGRFSIHSSATMVSSTFWCCSWQVFKATRPMESWYSCLWFLTYLFQLNIVGLLMVLKDLDPFCHEDIPSVVC